MNFTVTINLPANENLGTGAFFAVSTNYFENSTIHFISVTNDNAIESFPHKIRFSGTYIARVNISNKISSEVYEFEVKGGFGDAWWQQTYQVKSCVLGNVRILRTT